MMKILLVLLLWSWRSCCCGSFQQHPHQLCCGRRRSLPVTGGRIARRLPHCSVLQSTLDASSSIVDFLHDSLSKQDEQVFTISNAYVTAKRSFGSSLAFLDLISSNITSFQALLKRDVYQGSHYEGSKKCLFPGTMVQLQGVAAPTRNPGEVVLLIQELTLLEVPRQPQHVRAILNLGQEGLLPLEEIAAACHMSTSDLRENLFTLQDPQNNRRHKALAKHIVSSMPVAEGFLEQMFSGKNNERRALPVAPNSVRFPHNYPEVMMPIETTTHSVKAVKQMFTGDSSSSSSFAISTLGHVQNRRRFEGNITIINLVDELSTNVDDKSRVVDDRRLECILHPNYLQEDSSFYGNLLAVGCKVLVEGILSLEERGDTVNTGHARGSQRQRRLWVNKVRLLRLSWRPITIRYALDLLHEGRLSVEEGAEALQLSSWAEAEALSELSDLTERQWKANEISAKLQSAASRVGILDPNVLSVLDNFSDARKRWPLLETQDPELDPKSLRLQESLPGSKWQRKKRPQLEWMVTEIAQVAQSHPEFGTRTIHVLDIGGGKGKLANYLAQYLGDAVHVHVVDIAKGAIANGAMRARRLQLSVNYRVADAAALNNIGEPIDIVVALHACGHLSDVALAHAVENKASFVICPCCFSSNRHLRIPKSRETVEDFLGIPAAQWSALKQVAEVQGDSRLASKAMHTICAIRAAAVTRKLSSNRPCSIQIKSFPIQYSTRNICLVGTTSAL